jgi:chromosomal replication initiation ATPase DnaA
LSPAPEILPYLARRMDRSFDAARRLVARLDETALSTGRPITRAMAAKVLDKMAQ